MDIAKFIDLVERMREAQTTWFKTKNRNALQRAIILEGLCDEEIKTYKSIQRDKFKEPGLFDNMP